MNKQVYSLVFCTCIVLLLLSYQATAADKVSLQSTKKPTPTPYLSASPTPNPSPLHKAIQPAAVTKAKPIKEPVKSKVTTQSGISTQAVTAIDPYSFLQYSYTYSSYSMNPRSDFGDITGASSFNNGTKFALSWTMGRIGFFSEESTTPTIILLPYITLATGIAEVPAEIYGGDVAVTSKNAIYIYDQQGNFKKGISVKTGSDITDITYDKARNRIILATRSNIGVLQENGTILPLINVNGVESVKALDMESNPLTYDLIQMNSDFIKLTLEGNVQPVNPRSTYLGEGGLITGIAYTKNFAIMAEDWGYFVYPKLAFQSHLETGSYNPTITLISPVNKFQSTTTNNITFQYSVASQSSLMNCSLIINSTVAKTAFNPPVNTELIFNYTLDNTNYTWHIKCTDANNRVGVSEVRELVVNVTQDYDTDSDGVPDSIDNCRGITNHDQSDADSNGLGDACETTDIDCDNTEMVWRDNNIIIRRDKYNVLMDRCDGFRPMITNTEIGPQCYNINECREIITGKCILIPSAKNSCSQAATIKSAQAIVNSLNANIVDPYTYLQPAYTYSSAIPNPRVDFGSITGADSFNNGTDFLLIWANGRVGFFTEGQTSPYKIISTSGTQGMTEIPKDIYGGEIAVTSNNAIWIYNRDGTFIKGINVYTTGDILDITYDKARDRFILTTANLIGVLQTDGTLLNIMAIGGKTAIHAIDMESNPNTYDMLQVNADFLKFDSQGNLQPGNPFYTNLASPYTPRGIAYTKNNAIMAVSGGYYVYPKLAFQSHLETGSYNPTITLTSPINKFQSTTTNNITFQYSIASQAALRNCSLIINSTVAKTAFNPPVNTQLQFNQVLDNTNYTWHIKCIDANGSVGVSEVRELNVSVPPANNAPVLSGIGNKVVNESELLTIQLFASDADNDELNYSITENLPSSFSFNNETGLFSWTPTYSDAGKYNVTFAVTDGKASDNETITITVNNVNQAPTITPIVDMTVEKNEQVAFTVQASDYDNDTLTFLPLTLTIPVDGIIRQYNVTAEALDAFNTLTGDFAWKSSLAGIFYFTFSVTDGQFTVNEEVKVIVKEQVLQCNSMNMVWYYPPDTATIIRTQPYQYPTDQCEGYRCVKGNEISPACYNEDECAACNGTCVHIALAREQCAG